MFPESMLSARARTNMQVHTEKAKLLRGDAAAAGGAASERRVGRAAGCRRPRHRPPLLPELHLDPHSVTISGISSGAAMTNQLAVAFSESFAGAAAFAGKPWNCEQVSTPGFVRPTTHGGNTCNKNVSLIVVEKLV